MTDRPGGSDARIRLLLRRRSASAEAPTSDVLHRVFQRTTRSLRLRRSRFSSVSMTRDISDVPHSPYALVAFEFDTAPGVGQADGGDHAGQYLELGIAPGYTASRASLTVPVKVGMSLGDYYELNVVRQRHLHIRGQPLRLRQRGGACDDAARRHHDIRRLERPWRC